MAIYSRFGSKEGVVEALYSDGFAELTAALGRVRRTASPANDVARLTEAYRAFALDRPSVYSVMFERVIAEFRAELERSEQPGYVSRYDDAAFTKACQDARALTDRTAQAKRWQELDKQAAQLALVLPTRFGREQRLVGSKVDGAYIWSPYGSWPYAALAVSD